MKKEYPLIDTNKTGINIRNIMEEKGFTVKEIQYFLGFSTPQSVYHWFDGRNLPSLDNLYALSELFQVPMDELIVGNREYQSGESSNKTDEKSENVSKVLFDIDLEKKVTKEDTQRRLLKYCEYFRNAS